MQITEREWSVVKGIAEGLTYKAIARLLGVSEKTIATYRERAAEKIGCTTRVELVRWALQHAPSREENVPCPAKNSSGALP